MHKNENFWGGPKKYQELKDKGREVKEAREKKVEVEEKRVVWGVKKNKKKKALYKVYI